MTQIYKYVRTLKAPPPKIGGPQTSNFQLDFRRHLVLIANVCRTQQNNRQSKNGAASNNHFCTARLT